MSSEIALEEFDRESAVIEIAKTVALSITSTNKPEHPLNQINIQRYINRLINITDSIEGTPKLELGNFRVALNINSLKDSDFDSALLKLLELSIQEQDNFGFDNAQLLEVRTILRVILLHSNYEYLDQLKDKLNLKEMGLFQKIPHIAFALDPSKQSNLGFDLNLLVITCISYGVTSLTYKHSTDQPHRQLEAGLNTAYIYLVIAAKFIMERFPDVNDSAVNKIIRNSYSTFFLPLMMTPLNIFVAFDAFITSELSGPSEYMQIIEKKEGEFVIQLKPVEEIERAILKLLAQFDDESISKWLEGIRSSLPLVSCPALSNEYLKFVL